jgi:hypothetical protein
MERNYFLLILSTKKMDGDPSSSLSYASAFYCTCFKAFFVNLAVLESGDFLVQDSRKGNLSEKGIF